MAPRPSRAPAASAASAASAADAAATTNILWLVATVFATVLLAWLSRGSINPDGVAYLDLARALREGRVAAFVQGYWSPLYPALLALLSPGIGEAHLVNGLAATGGACLVYGAVRRQVGAIPDADGYVVRISALWSAWVIAALSLVRVSAVTPDLLLLSCLTGWMASLRHPAGPRWIAAGTWLGLGFLAKTSLWPWLLVTTVIVAWRMGAPGRARRVLRYTGPTTILAACWLVPLSIHRGHPTVGVTGRLNACWYLRACDGQSPDTHTGAHVAYDSIAVAPGRMVVRARFADPGWTWAPWSDPDGWARGLVSQGSAPLTVARYSAIVMRNLGVALVFSFGPLLAGPLLALAGWWWLGRRSGARHRPDPEILLAGLIGTAQFVAVQAVTRTLAPFALLCVAAISLGARPTGQAPRSPMARRRRPVLAGLPVVVALAATLRVGRYEQRLAALADPYAAEVRDLMAGTGVAFDRRTVLVVGPALGLMPLAGELGARVVAQVLPRSVPTLEALPPSARHEAMRALGGGEAEVAWELDASAHIRVTNLR